MSEFDRPLSGARLVQILHGDTLQKIAARELGDASRWPDLANLNRLQPPYITDDPAQAGPSVLLSGGVLLVPARTGLSNASSNSPDEIYGRDIALVDGQLEADESGDLAIASGAQNLRQALVHRVVTERGELLFYEPYGSMLRSIIGSVNGPTASILAAQYTAAALRADRRVREVLDVRVDIQGDVVRVEAHVQPIIGRSVKIEASL